MSLLGDQVYCPGPVTVTLTVSPKAIVVSGMLKVIGIQVVSGTS